MILDIDYWILRADGYPVLLGPFGVGGGQIGVGVSRQCVVADDTNILEFQQWVKFVCLCGSQHGGIDPVFVLRVENCLHRPAVFFWTEDDVTSAVKAKIAPDDFIEVGENLPAFHCVD